MVDVFQTVSWELGSPENVPDVNAVVRMTVLVVALMRDRFEVVIIDNVDGAVSKCPQKHDIHAEVATQKNKHHENPALRQKIHPHFNEHVLSRPIDRRIVMRCVVKIGQVAHTLALPPQPASGKEIVHFGVIVVQANVVHQNVANVSNKGHVEKGQNTKEGIGFCNLGNDTHTDNRR